jgi:hypothetical protein
MYQKERIERARACLEQLVIATRELGTGLEEQLHKLEECFSIGGARDELRGGLRAGVDGARSLADAIGLVAKELEHVEVG